VIRRWWDAFRSYVVGCLYGLGPFGGFRTTASVFDELYREDIERKLKEIEDAAVSGKYQSVTAICTCPTCKRIYREQQNTVARIEIIKAGGVPPPRDQWVDDVPAEDRMTVSEVLSRQRGETTDKEAYRG